MIYVVITFAFAVIVCLFLYTIKLEINIMATLQELKDAIAAVNSTIAAEKAEVQAKLAALLVEIQTLKDQIASGGLVSQADLDALTASVTAIDAGVKDISEA
ncbi:MAG: hypothetical protein PHE50_00160 [Dehalococcoidales bacterium]|nr:hypothetical protein [Dehalococcoidales bacterium]